MPRGRKRNTPTPLTLAFAGSAEVDYENVKTLLNDLIGVTEEDADGYPVLDEEREINLIFPADRTTDAIKAALDWSEYADLEYTAVIAKGGKNDGAVTKDASEEFEVSNVEAKIAELLADAEGDKYLIIAFGEADEDEVLLDLVLKADVPAKDLADGLDDIVFNDDDAEPEKDEPDDEPEPEPEPEEKPARRGRRGRSTEEAKPAEEELTEDDVAKAEEKPKRTRRTKAQIAADKAAEEAEAAANEQPDEAQALIAPDHLRVDHATQGFNAAGNPVSGSTLVDLANRFGFHPGTEDTIPRHEQVRQLTFELAVKLSALVPPGRELSTTLTKLEEAGFWANAGIARHLAPLEAEPLVDGPEPAQDGAESDAEPSEGRRSRGRPRKDGTPAQPRSEEDKAKTLVENEDGEYVPRGRGRPRAGQRTRKDV